jgi:hypothetical protein
MKTGKIALLSVLFLLYVTGFAVAVAPSSTPSAVPTVWYGSPAVPNGLQARPVGLNVTTDLIDDDDVEFDVEFDDDDDEVEIEEDYNGEFKEKHEYKDGKEKHEYKWDDD